MVVLNILDIEKNIVTLKMYSHTHIYRQHKNGYMLESAKRCKILTMLMTNRGFIVDCGLPLKSARPHSERQK